MRKEYASLRLKFLRIYINLPDKIRSEDVVAVIDHKPYTWNNAAIEIKNNTETGYKILNILKKLKIVE